jgi:putative peptidoglycan lipid II flippase
MVFASFFGTSLYADTFTVAFRLPNLFRSVFAEGALSAAFVPLFSKKFAHEGLSSSLHFASIIFTILLAVLTVIIILFEVFMPYVVRAIAPGFEHNPYEFALAVKLTRIMLPYLFFVSLVAFYSCILNSINEFAALAFSPIILNVAMIFGLYFFGYTQPEKVIACAWSVLAGGVLQLVVIVRATTKHGVLPSFKIPDVSCSDVRAFFCNITPAFLSSSVSQINIWIGTIIVTSLPGAAATLYFADRIVQLPISLIGVSLGTVLLPTLSKTIRSGDRNKTHYLQNRAIEISLALSLPCLVVLFVMAAPIVFILFQRGAFLAADTGKTAPALFMFALGLPAYVINKILVSSFFAHEETKTPFKISVACVAFNIAGNLMFIGSLGHVGIALSTTLSGWMNTILLIIIGLKKEIFKFDSQMKDKLVRIMSACAILLIFLRISLYLAEAQIRAAPITSFIVLLVLAALGYIAAIFGLRAYSVKEIKKLM